MSLTFSLFCECKQSYYAIFNFLEDNIAFDLTIAALSPLVSLKLYAPVNSEVLSPFTFILTKSSQHHPNILLYYIRKTQAF
ncbi:hypothetical protein NEOCIP111885_03666 [Pseudoneobacillus rhizosphaerae]|uniref:Uncharacterized protein n=1 Tax=Pseudoneobacillus rhizosphaerae TaxID=2880968 RepID=A0A9C7GCS3_9BACI|nr:hypothetical protein NEOCIP111885_03666 [Pseudoneobacillus rhizosphaerae]